jgi:hypothetical protein
MMQNQAAAATSALECPNIAIQMQRGPQRAAVDGAKLLLEQVLH